MREYVVYREGWDPATQKPSQGLPEKMPVLRISANSPEEACEKAARQVQLGATQRLSAEPADEVDARNQALDLTAHSMNSDDAGETDPGERPV